MRGEFGTAKLLCGPGVGDLPGRCYKKGDFSEGYFRQLFVAAFTAFRAYVAAAPHLRHLSDRGPSNVASRR